VITSSHVSHDVQKLFVLVAQPAQHFGEDAHLAHVGNHLAPNSRVTHQIMKHQERVLEAGVFLDTENTGTIFCI
jgi:hypothetical protein